MTKGNAALFAWPSQAKYGKTVPKTSVYAHGGASKRLKELFARQVEQIVWHYKLSPETTNLPARHGITEIQVFTLLLKTPQCDRDLLRTIDEAVKFPVLFELIHGVGEAAQVQMVACYKRPSLVDAKSWVQSGYFATDWSAATSPRIAMPVALDMAGLYEQLLYRLLPLPARPQETLPELVSRVEQVAAKQREVEKAEARLGKEKQFNHKVEINAQLRQLQQQIRELTS